MKKELEKLVNSKRSVIVSGNTLSGKTAGVMFPVVDEIIKKGESLFVIDSRQEYLYKYNEDLKNNGYKVVVINFSDPRYGDGWNPYTYIKDLYSNDNKDKALALLDLLHSRIFINKNAVDPFWDNTAADLCSASALSLIKYASDEEVNINSVSNIVTSCSTKLKSSTFGVEYFKSFTDEDICGYSNAVVNAPIETRGGIISVASQKLRLYASREYLSRLLNKSTFRYDELSEKIAIFVELPKQETYMSSLALMLLEQLLHYIDDNNVNKINIILDNYDLLDNDHNLYNLLSFNNPNKSKLYVITRSINSIKEKTNEHYETLTTIVRVKEEKIEFSYSDDETISVDKTSIDEIEDKNIELKDICSDDIVVFKVEDYIYKNNLAPSDVADLIARIDKKLEELEKEEKQYENKEEA